MCCVYAATHALTIYLILTLTPGHLNDMYNTNKIYRIESTQVMYASVYTGMYLHEGRSI